jgi:hypothetical protein
MNAAFARYRAQYPDLSDQIERLQKRVTLSGMRAFASGFLIFTDYARGAIRLASLMEQPVLHIWTQDSISVGEDGPTHQPIEQILSLRAIPGMIVIRPADANDDRSLSFHSRAQEPTLSAKRATARGDGKGHGRGSLTNRLLGHAAWSSECAVRHVGADEDRRRAFRLQGGACVHCRPKHHPPRGGRNELAR